MGQTGLKFDKSVILEYLDEYRSNRNDIRGDSNFCKISGRVGYPNLGSKMRSSSLDRLSDCFFFFFIIIVVFLMYFFWCTKYLINAPLGELKKKKKKKLNLIKLPIWIVTYC